MKTCGFDDIHIDVTKKSDQNKLYSAFGAIRAKGTKADTLVFKEVNACGDIDLEHVSIGGRVLSNFGKVYAAYSVLGDVNAANQITLKNSMANKVQSLFGGVTIAQDAETNSKIGSIFANSGVRLDAVLVEGKIRSEFGTVEAKKSTLQKVFASGNIDLINSAAKKLTSEFGKVSVRQTDGTKRLISHITARGEAIVEGSLVEDVTLHVSQDKRGVLDFKNSEIGEVVIKVDNVYSGRLSFSSLFWNLFRFPFSKTDYFYANVNGKEFHSLAAYQEYQRTGCVSEGDAAPAPQKRFSLLIKGDEMPKNISFEGFETDEISSEKTDEGVLVRGEKK